MFGQKQTNDLERRSLKEEEINTKWVYMLCPQFEARPRDGIDRGLLLALTEIRVFKSLHFTVPLRYVRPIQFRHVSSLHRDTGISPMNSDVTDLAKIKSRTRNPCWHK